MLVPAPPAEPRGPILSQVTLDTDAISPDVLKTVLPYLIDQAERATETLETAADWSTLRFTLTAVEESPDTTNAAVTVDLL